MRPPLPSGSQTAREISQLDSGGGVLAVVLDLSVADPVLHHTGQLARPGASPLTVLAQVRRPPVPPAFPCGLIGPQWPDELLLAEARDALSLRAHSLVGHGNVDLRLLFSGIEKRVVRLLRERDYAHVVIGCRSSLLRRRECRRIESAASTYCAVDVLRINRAGSIH